MTDTLSNKAAEIVAQAGQAWIADLCRRADAAYANGSDNADDLQEQSVGAQNLLDYLSSLRPTLSNKIVDTQELGERAICLLGEAAPDDDDDERDLIEFSRARNAVILALRTTQCSGDTQELAVSMAGSTEAHGYGTSEFASGFAQGEKVAREALSALRTTHSPSEAEVEAFGVPMSDADLSKHYEASKRDQVGLVGSEVRQLVGEIRHHRAALPSDKTVDVLREARRDLRDGMNRADDSRNMPISILRYTIDRVLAKFDSHLGEMK